MIDIVKIKNANYLIFYVSENHIYCENIVSHEKVIVGELKENTNG